MRYMSITLSILGFNLIATPVKAQEEIKLDDVFEPTATRKYYYLRTLNKEKEGLAFTDRDKDGAIVQQGYFKDEEMNTRVGHFTFYQNGKKLYEGKYVDGNPRGKWYFYKAGKLNDSIEYTEPMVKLESIKKTETPEGLVYIVNIRTSKDPDSVTFARVEVESEFPGGNAAWQKYLVRTLQFPEIVQETVKPFTKQVNVQFIVCTDGTVCDVQPTNSVHPLLDLQAVNAIRKGPTWIPAEQNQRKVKSYKKQPIVFSLTVN